MFNVGTSLLNSWFTQRKWVGKALYRFTMIHTDSLLWLRRTNSDWFKKVICSDWEELPVVPEGNLLLLGRTTSDSQRLCPLIGKNWQWIIKVFCSFIKIFCSIWEEWTVIHKSFCFILEELTVIHKGYLLCMGRINSDSKRFSALHGKNLQWFTMAICSIW